MSDQVKIDRLTERLAAAEALVTELRALLQHEQVRADQAEKRADVALTLADRTLAQLAKANDRADQTEKRDDLAWTLMERWAASEKDARREVVDVQGDLQRVRQEADDQHADIARLDVARNEARQARDAVQKAEHDRDAAVAIGDEGVRAAEELRQAQAARAGQGRWARLRAAWLGE